MKKRVLLVDESLTVQKVVALTLDKNKFTLSFAKNRGEVMKLVVENPPDLMLVSDQVADINVGSFPKELEAWLGGVRDVPPVVLITGQDIKEHRHYAAVLRKPFAPQALQAIVLEHAQTRVPAPSAPEGNADEYEDQRLQKIFNDTFADEASLMRETFKNEIETEERTLVTERPGPSRNESANLWEEKKSSAPAALWNDAPAKTSDDLWGPAKPPAAPSAPPAAEAAFVSESQIEQKLKEQDLSEVIERVLARVIPPIVERLVQERLDKLLKEQEHYFELKP